MRPVLERISLFIVGEAMKLDGSGEVMYRCCLKNMETIYWTCGGVANMVNIIIVRLHSFFLGSHNSQEVTLPRKSQLPCAITFSSSHYPPLHLDWPHAPKKVDPSNYTGPMPPKSFKPGYRSKWQFYRNFEKTYIMTEVPQ